MVATRGRTFKRPWRRSCLSSKLKSSSAPIGRKDSWCFHAVGSSNAPLRGSTAAEGLPRIGRTSIATRWRSCGLPQSASCSENFVIPPDVSGQTLSFWKNDRDIPRVSARTFDARIKYPSVAKCRAEFVGSKGVRRFRVDALIASICVARLRNPHDAGLHPHGIGRRVVCTSDRYRRTDLPFVNDAARSRALHTSLSRTSHMDQNLERLIRERAYQIWASRGCVHGQADQHWLAAEREILMASTAAFAGKAAPQKKRPLPARSKITKTLARSG